MWNHLPCQLGLRTLLLLKCHLVDLKEGKDWQNKTSITNQSSVEVVLLQVIICRLNLHMQCISTIKIVINKFSVLINEFTPKL